MLEHLGIPGALGRRGCREEGEAVSWSWKDGSAVKGISWAIMRIGVQIPIAKQYQL